MKFYGELLIFVLLFITNLRVFFVNSPKRDPLVAVAPFTFLLSICQIFAWGVDLFTVLGVLISFLVLLSNFHAMFRYSERLYVDHYSVLMRVWAIFTDILSLSAIVGLLFFAPRGITSAKINVVEQEYKYSGDFTGGFSKAGTFDRIAGTLYQFEPSDKNENYKDVSNSNSPKEIVLFIPDKRGDTSYYKPYLQLLAKEGFTVVSGDFFARDCKWFHSILDSKILRRFGMVTESLSDNVGFNGQREFYTYNISLECKALLKLLKEKYGENTKIFIISDVMGNTAVSDFARANSKNITGTFFLDSIPEYLSAGYGCVAQTSPIINTILGLPREKKFATPKLLVEKSKENIVF